MKYYTFFLMLSCLAFSQPVITSNNYFQIGDNVLIAHKLDIELLDHNPGSSGENITWDFSSVNFEHPAVTTNSLSFIEPSGTPFYPTFLDADYSNANLCCLVLTEDSTSSLNNQYNYFIKDNSTLEYIGQWADNPSTEIWNDNYSNPFEELIFPISYGQSNSDTFQRSYLDYSSGMTLQVTGTVSFNVDGYGTLITPDNETINNAIRIHRIESGLISNPENMSYSYEKHTFIWYAEGKRGFILKFDMSINDSLQIDTAEYNKSSISLNVSENNREVIGLYPIPVKEVLNVNANNKIEKLEFFNSSGSYIYSSVPVDEKVNVSFLKKGVYILKITLENKEIIIKKIIKE